MENRLLTRYSLDQLPKIIPTVLLVLPDKLEVESQLVDISSQGMKLSIPPTPFPLAIPRKAETVEVVLHASRLRLTCRCIYSAYNPDGSIIMGLHVFDPHQQGLLRKILEGAV
jgi:hypothetical protein